MPMFQPSVSGGGGNLPAGSGDATGATDYAAIQAALTAARLAGGGVVKGLAGSTYLINNTLEIGSGTTLDMTACTVRMVANTNKLMLANYSSLYPITTDGRVAAGSGQALWTLQSTSDPAYVAMANDALEGAGWSWDVPMTIGGAALRFVGTVGLNGLNTATRQFRQISGTSPATIGYTTFRLYRRDCAITVQGGVWDRLDNGSGDTETNHVMRWRGIDGLVVRDVTFLSVTFNAGRYAALVQNTTNFLFEGIRYGVNPASGSWQPTAGYASDGVHITGPSEQGVIRDIWGFTGDDMVAITASDFAGIAGDYWGAVRYITIENVRSTAAGQCSIKVMGGPSTPVEHIAIRNVYGQSSSSAGMITIGDDNRQTTTSGGLFDNITIENVSGNPGSTRSLITIAAASAIGRVTLRGIHWDLASNTSPGVVALGGNLYGPGPINTSVGTLVAEDFNIKGINASAKAIYVPAGSSIGTLYQFGWTNPSATESLVGGGGTITTTRVG